MTSFNQKELIVGIDVECTGSDSNAKLFAIGYVISILDLSTDKLEILEARKHGTVISINDIEPSTYNQFWSKNLKCLDYLNKTASHIDYNEMLRYFYLEYTQNCIHYYRKYYPSSIKFLATCPSLDVGLLSAEIYKANNDAYSLTDFHISESCRVFVNVVNINDIITGLAMAANVSRHVINTTICKIEPDNIAKLYGDHIESSIFHCPLYDTIYMLHKYFLIRKKYS